MHNKVQYHIKCNSVTNIVGFEKFGNKCLKNSSENLQQKLLIIQTKQLKTFSKGYAHVKHEK